MRASRHIYDDNTDCMLLTVSRMRLSHSFEEAAVTWAIVFTWSWHLFTLSTYSLFLRFSRCKAHYEMSYFMLSIWVFTCYLTPSYFARASMPHWACRSYFDFSCIFERFRLMISFRFSTHSYDVEKVPFHEYVKSIWCTAYCIISPALPLLRYFYIAMKKTMPVRADYQEFPT